MKRKIFSAILFGALLTASTSGLTSCKDYDDDISNLQGQIDKLASADELATKASELQAAIAAAQSAAEAKAAAAQSVADAAKAAAADAAAAAAKAQSGTDDAAKAAAAAQTIAEAAQKAVAELEANSVSQEVLDAAQEAVTAIVSEIQETQSTDKDAIEGLINSTKDELLKKIEANTKALEALEKRIKAVEDKLFAGSEGGEIDLSGIQNELKSIESDLEAIVGAVSAMVTNIQLYNNMGSNNGGTYGTIYPYNADLFFAEVTEKENVFPKNGETGDDKFEFKENEVRTLEDSVLVRVNPVNAELKAENISLINSQGKELNGLIEVTDVARYSSKAPLTRAENVENGLWVIKFKPVDNYDAEAFEEAALYEKRQIVYAVSVKNTDKNLEANRRVISEYGLTLAAGPVEYNDNFTVSQGDDNSCDIRNIHNRYLMCEDDRYSTENIEELDWLDAKKPATAANDENSVNRKDYDPMRRWTGYDNRQGKDIFIAKVGEDIKIDFPANYPIKGFYVTLDYKRALESAPTELNAWNSYTYENVTTYNKKGEVLKAGKLQIGNSGYINVKDMGGVNGDVIGFRVFAVNLDGTLVDPDGRAFYVGLGIFNNDVKVDDKTITLTYDAYKDGNGYLSDVIDLTNAFDCEFEYVTAQAVEGRKNGHFNINYNKLNGSSNTSANAAYELVYVDENNAVTTDLSKVKGLQVKILRPELIEDNAPVEFTLELKANMANQTSYTTRKVTFNITKALPNEVPAFNYIAQQTEKQIMVPVAYGSTTANYVVKTDRTADNNVIPKYGYKDLNNVYIFNKDSERFKNDPAFSYEISESAFENNDPEDKKIAQNITTPYEIWVPGQLVDNSVSHSVISSYIYYNVSRIWVEETSTWKYGPNGDHTYLVTEDSKKPLVYMSWASYNKYKWTKKNGKDWQPSVEWKPNGSGSAVIELKDLLVVNTADGATFDKGDLAEYLTAEWLIVRNASTDIRTYTGSQDNPYFTATLGTNTADEPIITLSQAGSTQEQAAPKDPSHTEQLEIKVVDCFGISYTIDLPFTVTRQ